MISYWLTLYTPSGDVICLRRNSARVGSRTCLEVLRIYLLANTKSIQNGEKVESRKDS